MAGLIIDGSTPAFSVTGSSIRSNTCASFTPPADVLLLVMWAGDSAGGTLPPTPTVSSSPAQTWTTDGWASRSAGSPSVDGQAAAFHTVLTTSPGATTVTVVNGATTAGTEDSYMQVYVFTGHDPITPIGYSQIGRQNAGSSVSDSYTASISGSQGFLVLSDWNAGDTTAWFPASGCSFTAIGTVPGLISYAVIQRINPDGILGVPTPLGVTGLAATGQYQWVILEVVSHDAVLAAAGQAGYPAVGANAPMF